VPRAASVALKDCVASKDYSELIFPGGHIGIYVSAQAQKLVPPAIGAWIAERSGERTKINARRPARPARSRVPP
jgi:polyhydroxyalkanoate synthase